MPSTPRAQSPNWRREASERARQLTRRGVARITRWRERGAPASPRPKQQSPAVRRVVLSLVDRRGYWLALRARCSRLVGAARAVASPGEAAASRKRPRTAGRRPKRRSALARFEQAADRTGLLLSRVNAAGEYRRLPIVEPNRCRRMTLALPRLSNLQRLCWGRTPTTSS